MGKHLDKSMKVIEAVKSGSSLKQALATFGLHSNYFYSELESDETLYLSYERAQQARAELLVDEIVEIADTERDPQTARNRIDVRKWYASKMQPKKYGDRIDLNVTQTVDVSFALNEARKRVQTKLVESIQHVDTKPVLVVGPSGSQPDDPPETRDAIDLELEDLLK